MSGKARTEIAGYHTVLDAEPLLRCCLVNAVSVELSGVRRDEGLSLRMFSWTPTYI